MPPLQVRFTSVIKPFQVRSCSIEGSEPEARAERKENEGSTVFWQLKISPQKKHFRANPTYLHRHPV